MSKRNIIGLALLVICWSVFAFVGNDVDKQDNVRYVRQKVAEWTHHEINTPGNGEFTLTPVTHKRFGALLSVKGTATSKEALGTLKNWVEKEFPTFRDYVEYQKVQEMVPAKAYRLVKYEVNIKDTKEAKVNEKEKADSGLSSNPARLMTE